MSYVAFISLFWMDKEDFADQILKSKLAYKAELFCSLVVLEPTLDGLEKFSDQARSKTS